MSYEEIAQTSLKCFRAGLITSTYALITTTNVCSGSKRLKRGHIDFISHTSQQAVSSGNTIFFREANTSPCLNGLHLDRLASFYKQLCPSKEEVFASETTKFMKTTCLSSEDMLPCGSKWYGRKQNEINTEETLSFEPTD